MISNHWDSWAYWTTKPNGFLSLNSSSCFLCWTCVCVCRLTFENHWSAFNCKPRFSFFFVCVCLYLCCIRLLFATCIAKNGIGRMVCVQESVFPPLVGSCISRLLPIFWLVLVHTPHACCSILASCSRCVCCLINMDRQGFHPSALDIISLIWLERTRFLWFYHHPLMLC